MTTRKSNVKIENGKVVFSQEVLEYYESIRTKENSEWIDKYFEVLSDSSNIIATKFEVHHIIPIFTFRNEIHKNRKEIENLADKVKENLIKLSIQNHIKAHNYLRLIFKNTIYEGYAKSAVYMVCRKKNVENFTESEIDEIAKIIEDCAKENQTKEEKLRKRKEYNDKHENDRIYWYNTHKNERKEWMKQWEEKHKQERIEYRIKYNKENRKEHNRKQRIYNNLPCYDPIKHDNCKLNALLYRKRKHKTLYININPRDCIIKDPQQSEITIFNL